MNNRAYREALRYASRFHPVLYRDLVHDAYLAYYKSKKDNLFNQHRGVITKTVKNVCYSQLIVKNRFMYKGKNYQKVFLPVLEDFKEVDISYIVPTTHNTALDILIEKDSTEQIELGIEDKYLYKLVKDGLNPTEIGKELGISRQLVTYRINKIKKVINNVLELN